MSAKVNTAAVITAATIKSVNLEVTGLGLCTPIGIGADAVPYEIDSGLVRMFQTSVPDRTGEPVRASMLSIIDEKASRTERMAAMAGAALEDCMTGMQPMKLASVPFFLALPRADEGAPYLVSDIVETLDHVASTMQFGPLSRPVLVQEGRASFFRALELAAEKLLDIDVTMVLVGAIDSMCDLGTLGFLAEQNRVVSDDNRDGIIPGEAAGFVTLISAGDRTALGQAGDQAATRIIAIASDNEPRPFLFDGSRQGDQGEALTRVFGALCTDANVMALRPERLLSCQTTESYWTDEFAHAYLRNHLVLPEPLVAPLITQSLGDIGAAAGLFAMAQAAHLLINNPLGKGSARRAMLYGSSDHGLVGACILDVFGGMS